MTEKVSKKKAAPKKMSEAEYQELKERLKEDLVVQHVRMPGGGKLVDKP